MKYNTVRSYLVDKAEDREEEEGTIKTGSKLKATSGKVLSIKPKWIVICRKA